ncbi:MAG: prephenate dehydrogenase/arogenate dehydrogenase family protein [Actinomycetota bacterium]|nr:prephenate dehydrogenase/arogenate dehydrogenase family protein [Actinomycetota bacterium]
MSTASGPGRRRAVVVGTGLIGGSVGMALRSQGWHVSGIDLDPAAAAEARAAGAVDATGDDPDAELVVVATPLGPTPSAVRHALAGHAHPGLVVTDVAAVKAGVTAAVGHPRFVGGHPMAGSEQVGVAGAHADLFVGATWVLTPTQHTDPDAFAAVRAMVTSLGADVVALSPEQHDALVAVVSHVPHLTAATLMNLAGSMAEQHAALLRLAAGGFRDMTRVAAGDPHIWPDVCVANAPAIVEVLDRLVAGLQAMRDRVVHSDRAGILADLGRAAGARRALPVGGEPPEQLAEVRVPVPDRPGVLAQITTLAGDLGLNVFDLEIAHSTEGDRGVLVLVVDASGADTLQHALTERGYQASLQVIA